MDDDDELQAAAQSPAHDATVFWVIDLRERVNGAWLDPLVDAIELVSYPDDEPSDGGRDEGDTPDGDGAEHLDQ